MLTILILLYVFLFLCEPPGLGGKGIFLALWEIFDVGILQNEPWIGSSGSQEWSLTRNSYEIQILRPYSRYSSTISDIRGLGLAVGGLVSFPGDSAAR